LVSHLLMSLSFSFFILLIIEECIKRVAIRLVYRILHILHSILLHYRELLSSLLVITVHSLILLLILHFLFIVNRNFVLSELSSNLLQFLQFLFSLFFSSIRL
ncbi:hypothetical protein PFISCL1PPCAC_1841, partial [Pristionchus fissidentatus]